MPEAVEVATGVFVLNGRNELLIVTGKKFPDWVIPGGHVEPGEKMLDCGRRELLEETGIDCGAIKFLSVNEITNRMISGSERHLVYLNLCCRAAGNNPQVRLNAELSQFEWVPLEQALSDERINKEIREQVLPQLADFVERKLV